MELLERYLQAVRFFLPRGQQDDISRELAENLRSQMEDREEELGRPLTDDEQADILRRHGHPMIVAGRYRSSQFIIGPAFFPIYIFALKVGLAASVLVTVVMAIIGIAIDGNPLTQIGHAIKGLPDRALLVFAWTTLGFVVLDAAQRRLKLSAKWDPRQLPKVTRPEVQIPRARTLFELLFVAAWVVLLVLLPWPFLIFAPALAFLTPAPVWQTVYLPVVLLGVAAFALHAVNFARPYRTATRAWARVGLNVASLTVVAALLNASVWVLPGSDGSHQQEIQRLVSAINLSVRIGLIVTFVVTFVEIGADVHRILRRSWTNSTTEASVRGAR
jgi:hypothetical protein